LLAIAAGRLELTDFEMPSFQVLWEALSEYYKQFRRLPTTAEYYHVVMAVIYNTDGRRQSMLTQEEYPAFEELFRKVNDPTIDKNTLVPDFYQSNLGEFIRYTRISKHWAQSQVAMQMGIGTADIVEQMAKISKEADAVGRRRKFSGMREDPGFRRAGATSLRISTGCSKLDALLDGGIQPTQLGCITGTPGTGKTNALVHLGTAGALSGVRCLFLSHELTAVEIKRRHAAMAMAIHGKYLKMPLESWPDAELFRASVLVDPNFRACDFMLVADMSDRRYPIYEVETQIELWKEHVKKETGTDEDCLLVCLDWLDMLLPPRGMEDKSPEALSQLGHEAKFIAKRQHVGLWTATQGTRDADGKAIVRMRHMAGAYHKNDALDIGVGIGRVEDPLTVDVKQSTEGIGMIWSINKNREGQQGSVELYQAPTLRFYDSKEVYQAHLNELENPLITADLKLMHSIQASAGSMKVTSPTF